MEFKPSTAADIHKNSPVVDAHFDLPMIVEKQRSLGRKKVIEQDYLDSFKRGGVNLIIASVFIDDQFIPEMALRKALNQLAGLHFEIEESADKLMLCRNYDDINNALQENKLGLMFSLEGVEPLYNDPSLLKIFFELGVRILGLVWSRRNFAGDGSSFKEIGEVTEGGITPFGRELIEQAEDMGMLIDLSHLNDPGFWDAMAITKKPVIASHSNCRKLAGIKRNLTDDQIKAIAEKGGVIGVNVISMMLTDKNDEATMDHMVEHVDHIVSLAGPEYVGLGLDFNDIFFKELTEDNLGRLPCKPFDVIKGHRSLVYFTEKLLKKGYQLQIIKKILGENFLAVLKNIR